jgi:hypothetical protein
MKSKRLKQPIVWLLIAGMWIGFAWLLCGCKTHGSGPERPSLPMAFHFMEPGSTNTVIVPVGCRYGIWTTDKGLLYLQGLQPEE